MLNVFTVSFFGHRELDGYFYLESKLKDLIGNLIRENEYVNFLVGRNGEFDNLVSYVIRQMKNEYGNEKCNHTLVLPYCTAEYRNNMKSFEKYYDYIEIYEEVTKSYFKSAITERNKRMVDNSDLIIFYIERNYGGCYNTYKYALKKNKSIILLGEDL